MLILSLEAAAQDGGPEGSGRQRERKGEAVQGGRTLSLRSVDRVVGAPLSDWHLGAVCEGEKGQGPTCPPFLPRPTAKPTPLHSGRAIGPPRASRKPPLLRPAAFRLLILVGGAIRLSYLLMGTKAISMSRSGDTHCRQCHPVLRRCTQVWSRRGHGPAERHPGGGRKWRRRPQIHARER